MATIVKIHTGFFPTMTFGKGERTAVTQNILNRLRPVVEIDSKFIKLSYDLASKQIIDSVPDRTFRDLLKDPNFYFSAFIVGGLFTVAILVLRRF
jgi:hypothetical protein